MKARKQKVSVQRRGPPPVSCCTGLDDSVPGRQEYPRERSSASVPDWDPGGVQVFFIPLWPEDGR